MAQFDRSTQGSGLSNEATNTGEMLNPARGFAFAGAAAQSLVRNNLELMSLASRRARAQVELPRKAMACRNPSDLGQLSVAFWRDAFQDYLDCSQRMMASWTQSLTDAGQGDLARSMTDFGKATMQPMATAAEEAGAAMTEHPTEPWAWWRTDMKGLKPARNGHHRSDRDEFRVGP